VADNGEIFVADTINNRIQVYDDSGSFIKTFSSQGSQEGQLFYPFGIHIDNDGTLLICDTYNHRVQGFNQEGEVISVR
tara:strand:- start:94610 stop:94843 length:234 start_codon:yes stop_codon:yes gene_type:complete